MPDMVDRRRFITLLFPPLLVALAFQSCTRADKRPSEPDGRSPSDAPTAQGTPIELEIVAPQTVAGAIAATGKILVPEDRIATIGRSTKAASSACTPARAAS
jgi:hypothetical protein